MNSEAFSGLSTTRGVFRNRARGGGNPCFSANRASFADFLTCCSSITLPFPGVWGRSPQEDGGSGAGAPDWHNANAVSCYCCINVPPPTPYVAMDYMLTNQKQDQLEFVLQVQGTLLSHNSHLFCCNLGNIYLPIDTFLLPGLSWHPGLTRCICK